MSQSFDGIYGVGSGSPYGLGFLAGKENPQDCILEALEASARYDVNTCAPFQLEYQPSWPFAVLPFCTIKKGTVMEMIFWAVGITLTFLFCMWMIIESDEYLVEQTKNPWEADNDSEK